MRKSRVTLPWLKQRGMQGAFCVLRLDDYAMTPLNRGQFVTEGGRLDDMRKAVWPTYEQAQGAAEWATNKFGHQYGVFKMITFVEPKEPVTHVKITKIGG